MPCLMWSCLDIQVKTNWGSNNDSHIISMDKAIFGDEYEGLLEKEHIYELLNHKEFLYEKLVCTRRLSNRFSFLSSHKLSMFKLDLVNVKKYVVDILLGNREKDKLFLAPYNSGAHWVLFAINATSEVIYYLDPLHDNYNNHSDIKTMFDIVLVKLTTSTVGTIYCDS
ncbi:uncharacterized protein [Cicer arietinum]|uniref:uncharacterized protein n=1 Tax=Cicer arietinum TaxID=3827 RepID=UPI003CC61130